MTAERPVIAFATTQMVKTRTLLKQAKQHHKATREMTRLMTLLTEKLRSKMRSCASVNAVAIVVSFRTSWYTYRYIKAGTSRTSHTWIMTKCWKKTATSSHALRNERWSCTTNSEGRTTETSYSYCLGEVPMDFAWFPGREQAFVLLVIVIVIVYS